MNDLKIFATHWSDNRQTWGRPFEADNLKLGAPFGYFTAENLQKAQELVSKLKPFRAFYTIDYYPACFRVGSYEIEVIRSSKRS